MLTPEQRAAAAGALILLLSTLGPSRLEAATVLLTAGVLLFAEESRWRVGLIVAGGLARADEAAGGRPADARGARESL